MRYTVYGVDAGSHKPREPLVVDAVTEEEARGRAVAQGMAVRAVIAEAPGSAKDPPAAAPESVDRPTSESDQARSVRRFILLVILPLVAVFFLVLAVLRTLWQAATWALVWGIGVLVGGGIAGLLSALARGAVPVEASWPIGLAVGITALSAIHGARVGWRWWWAKRSLSPLAQALGVAPEQAGDDEPTFLRVPVTCAQGLAGALFGTLGALAGWATDWHYLAVAAWTTGGAFGLAVEGAILGAILSRHRPLPPPQSASDSMSGVLRGLGGGSHISRTWVLGYALDRAVPGAVAGTFIGLVVFFLSWWLVGE